MKSATKKILNTLSERGYRVTKAREMVCQALEKSRSPLTVQELAGRVLVDEVSVYRTIDLLLAEKLVEEILIRDERPRYALSTHHHHHAVCHDCGKVAHIPCGREPQNPKRVPGFKSIDSHDLTFYGVCDTCSK